MSANYREMVPTNCRNSGKYFCCQRNYEPVHKCSGPLRVTIAAAILAMHVIVYKKEALEVGRVIQLSTRRPTDMAEMVETVLTSI